MQGSVRKQRRSATATRSAISVWAWAVPSARPCNFRSRSEPEQPPRVAAEDLRAVFGAEGNVAHPLHPGRVEDEGIVDGKQNPVHPHLEHAAQQRRRREVAAGGNPEMLAKAVAERRG